MSDFDHAAAFATQAEPVALIGRLLAGTRERWRFREWFNTRAIPLPGGPKRTADLVAVVDAPPDVGADPALLVFEFQSSHDEEKLDTTLVEAAVFRAYARHGEGNQRKYRVFCGTTARPSTAGTSTAPTWPAWSAWSRCCARGWIRACRR